MSSRAPVLTFGLVELVALGLRLRWARGAWFTLDDWEILSERTAGNLSDLVRPHAEHWSTLVILAYRFLWWSVGLNYLAYALFSITLYLVVAALVRVVMRRAGVGPWVATAAASLLVFYGAGGIENNFFTSALVFGLIQLFLADHDGPVNRRDVLALAAGLAALMCSGVGVTTTVVVGAAMLLKRGWRIALLQTVPLAAVYLIWLVAAPAGQSESPYHAHTLSNIVAFVVDGLRGSYERLGRLPGVGIVFAVLLVAGFAVMLTRQGVAVLRGRAAVPVAMLAGAVAFLFLTGAVRSGGAGGSGGFLTAGMPPAEIGRRYGYAVAAFALPALGLAAEALIRRWRVAAIVLAALVVASVPGHIHQFRTDARNFAATGSPGYSPDKRLILTAPRLPLARQLPRSQQIGLLGGPPLGWLLDSLPSGRVPSPGRLTPNDIATVTLQLALRQSTDTQLRACSPLTKPAIRVLNQGDLLTLKTGAANITYLPTTGGRSPPRPFRAGTVVALAGPLRLLVAPTPFAVAPTVICG